MAHVPEVTLIRMLIDGYQPSATPSRELFEHMNLLANQVDKLKRISRRERDPEIRKMLYNKSRYLERKKGKSIWW